MLHKLSGGDDKSDLVLGTRRIPDDDVTEGCCKHCRRSFMMDGRTRNSGGAAEGELAVQPDSEGGMRASTLKTGLADINSNNLSLRRRLSYNGRDGMPFIVRVKSESRFPPPFLFCSLACRAARDMTFCSRQKPKEKPTISAKWKSFRSISVYDPFPLSFSLH
jgi:hypothetical protein